MDNKTTTINYRTRMLMDTFYDGSYSIMSRKLNIPISTIRDLVLGVNKNVSKKTLDKILNFMPTIDRQWFYSGEGEMLISDNEKKKEDDNCNTIQYYPDVVYGMGNSDGGLVFSQNFKKIIIPGYSDCKYAINAIGESMSPLIQPGNIILLSDWKESFIEWGKIYLITTRNGYTAIKYVFPSTKEGYIECRSENPKFPPFDVEAGENLLPLYIVKGWICRNSF